MDKLKETKTRSWIYKAVDKGYKITKEGKVIGPRGERTLTKNSKKSGGDYYRFGIRGADNEHGNIHVHQFQAYHKFGDKMFIEGTHVRHLNGNSLDNTWDNIAIGTQSDNFMDQSKEVRVARATHAASFIKKFDHEQVYQFFMDNGRSWKKTMDEFGINSKGTLSPILKKKHAEHGTEASSNRVHKRVDLIKKHSD